MNLKSNELSALSPLDGRYQSSTLPLRKYFSELAINKYRIQVELQYWLFFLERIGDVSFSQSEQKSILKIVSDFDEQEAQVLKELENQTKHDVKAVEYYLRAKLTKLGHGYQEYIHVGLTSEDINSTAYALAMKDACHEVVFPSIQKIIDQLASIGEQEKGTPMLARTHGQPAVPTTVGKELIVVTMRLHEQLQSLKSLPFVAKLSGAVGNFNAQTFAFPDNDWLTLSDDFLSSLGLIPHHYSTQIVSFDRYLQLFHHFSMVNSILINFNQDMWRYISDEYFLQKLTKGEVGSSTMPQKVNPIDFENSEGNLGIANSLLQHFITKLPISRLQRDLSDSTVKRSIGSALGYCLIGYQSCLRGLSKVSVNATQLEQDLLNHWEIVTEGIQTQLRASGDEQAYEKLKELSRGHKISEHDIAHFIERLEVSEAVRQRLRQLSPLNYLGLSTQLVDKAIKELHESQS